MERYTCVTKKCVKRVFEKGISVHNQTHHACAAFRGTKSTIFVTKGRFKNHIQLA